MRIWKSVSWKQLEIDNNKEKLGFYNVRKIEINFEIFLKMPKYLKCV